MCFFVCFDQYVLYYIIHVVKVSTDELSVRRTTPLSEPSNVDERTLYVVRSVVMCVEKL